MRWIALLLSLTATVMGAVAALMLYARAPTFPFFALGLFAGEHPGWLLLLSLIGMALAVVVFGLPSPVARRLGVLCLIVSFGIFVATVLHIVRVVVTPPVVQSTIPSLQLPRTRVSLRSMFAAPSSRNSIRVVHDVPLLERDSVRLVADVYSAMPTPRGAPALIVVHGGAWRGGDKGEVPAANRHYAGQGFVVFDVTYRLAPQYPFPAAVRDVVCLIATIGDRKAAFGIDPEAMILMGRSAGAQIALLAAYASEAPFFTRDCPAPPRSVRAVVALYPPTRMSYYDIIQPELAPGALDDYLGGPPTLYPDRYRLARPMDWIGDHTPPTLLVHGSRDQYIRPDDVHTLTRALMDVGRSVVAVELPRANHGFDYIHNGVSAHQIQPIIDRFARYAVSPEAPGRRDPPGGSLLDPQ